MSKLKVGDIVVLKSGSPQMTVSESYENGWVKLVWFVDYQPKFSELHEDTLEKV
jgi:uncharacterized protein YodC (DUF2158 family)